MLRILSSIRCLLILLGCSVLPLMGMAQGWQRFVGGTSDQRAFSIRLTPDGGLVALGSTIDTMSSQTDWFFIRADSAGNILVQKSWGSPDSSEYGVSFIAVDSTLQILGNAYYPYIGPSGLNQRATILWQRTDYQGNVLSSAGNNSFISVSRGSIPFQNGHLVVGSNYLPYFDSFLPHPYWLFLDQNGVVLWSKTAQVANYGEAVDAQILDGQSTIILAKESGSTTLGDLILFKIDNSGGIITEKHFDFATNDEPATLLKSAAGDVLMVGNTGLNAQDNDIFIAKVDAGSLDTSWMQRIVLPGNQVPHAALPLSNGNIAIIGETIPENSSSRDAFFAMVDSVGNLLWFKTYGGIKGDIFWSIQESGSGNGFVIAGQTASFSPNGDLQAWLLRTDSLGQVWSNRVIGQVVREATQNCFVDSNETPLANWLVTASGQSGALYTLTDSMGRYSMNLDTGTWFISTLPPSGYWMPCEDSVEVFYGQFGDTLTTDFPTQVLYECPLLDVDLTIPYLRRCFENTNYVRYFNYGTSTAVNAVVSIELDPFLSITGSNLPFTQTGNTATFVVGTVPWLSGGNFEFNTYLDCDSTVLGQVHCMEAHIYPDSSCYQFNPEWDGSNLEVNGYCAGDSVVFSVSNTGAGMHDPVSYIITEDQIIFKLSTLQLGAGQDTTFVVYPNGSTVTIVVTQASGHPGNSQPMLVIEGCGAGTFTTGYAFQFPQNDGDPSIDIECRPNIGSFDPNDKTGLPLGVTDQGIIAPATTIEYLIRFQNTGTDTAFIVEIRDTIAAALDLATFKAGASSHPYRLNISGPGILHFLFDPIMLPDSTVNWAASQGFVKFSIAPKKGIAAGSQIPNRAAIYFDSNAPVLTNTTRHTIDNPIKHLNTKTTQVPGVTSADVEQLKIVPNPTSGRILMNLQRPPNSGGLHVEVFNLLGEKQLCSLQWPDPSNQAMELDLSGLPAGMYCIIVKNTQGSVFAQTRVVKI